MKTTLDAVAAGMPLAEAEQSYIGVEHGTAGAYLLGLWGLPFEVVEYVANHHTPTRISQGGFDVLSSVAVAHELLAQVKPGDVPVYDRNASKLGDDYLRSIGHSGTWKSLLEGTRELLQVEEGA
jgi:HD-like signal output (HDOD) protein